MRRAAGLGDCPGDIEDLLAEVTYLNRHADAVRPLFEMTRGRRVLYPGQCYYNNWYLSRALRERGWSADVLNWDLNEASQIYYHGEDFRFTAGEPYDIRRDLVFYLAALYRYDIFHFSNAHAIAFGFDLQLLMRERFGRNSEIHLLRALGKKIVYTNNGCLDGATRTGFASWENSAVCDICIWRDRPEVCGDVRNSEWGRFRNEVCDYQCLAGGNRVDYNRAPTVHEVPEAYSLDSNIWAPDLAIPEVFRIARPPGTTLLYHAVGNASDRTDKQGVNIKSSHIYLPLVARLRSEGVAVELISPSGVPNVDVRFIQAQADIFLEMLTFGWFGANAREALMLGKPVICYLREEWLASMRRELPDYVAELPIVRATADSVESVLRALIADPDERRRIGQRSREFSLKWHSAEAGARRLGEIYTRLLNNDAQLLPDYIATQAEV